MVRGTSSGKSWRTVATSIIVRNKLGRYIAESWLAYTYLHVVHSLVHVSRSGHQLDLIVNAPQIENSSSSCHLLSLAVT